MLLENLFQYRFDQMTVDELTVCASGFSISGFGSPYFSNVMEQGILQNVGELSTESLKEVARGFIFSMRGSKMIHQVLLPRLQPILREFTINELCYMLYSYHDKGYLPKLFAAEVEAQCKKYLVEKGADEVTLEELALIVKVFCTTRTAHRDFHKILETNILMRMPDLRNNIKILHAIGLSFEESGLCSIDTLKALKKEVFQVETENQVFED